MTIFPCAKINLGLNIVGVRNDGYHNIETVFYPIPLYDALEMNQMDEKFPSTAPCDLKITGNPVEGNENDNLVLKAYRLLAADFDLPRIHLHLYKHIPSQAGLGGGSSDAAYTIRLINERFKLNLSVAEMENYAAKIGADCAFFITSAPAYATGIGNELSPACHPKSSLNGHYLAIVKPNIAVSTKEAYAEIAAKAPSKCCRDIVSQPVDTWRNELFNDFELPVFKKYPELSRIKEQLYEHGALYASMSGSGSAIYGIFKACPIDIETLFPNSFAAILHL